ncbi:hypothetical protein LEMLEM_LOCUS12012 [Lemmus lemmus]
MLSCCFLVHESSDHKNGKSGGHGGGRGGAWRCQVHSWLQNLWPFGRKETNLNQGSQSKDHADQGAGTPQVTSFLVSSRYAHFYPDCEEDKEVKKWALQHEKGLGSTGTICTLLDQRIDEFPEVFSKTSDMSILKRVKTYLILNMPYSDLLVCVHDLHTKLQAEEASNSEDSD